MARQWAPGAPEQLLESYRNFLRLLARTGIDQSLQGKVRIDHLPIFHSGQGVEGVPVGRALTICSMSQACPVEDDYRIYSQPRA
jgi:hypothetical protein